MVVSSQSAAGFCARAWESFAAAAIHRLTEFERKLEDPASNQLKVLREVIDGGKESSFGREHGFSEIRTADDFKERVPVRRWPEFAPWIERARNHSDAVLTNDVPIHFERTSGSTARNKDIPYTTRFVVQVQRALDVWLIKLLESCPGVAGPSWWSLSPSPMSEDKAPNGIPIGSLSDAVYLHGCAAEKLLETVVDTRSAIAATDWKIETLARVVACEDLALISVWSPTFLNAILGALDDDGNTSGLKRIRALITARRYRELVKAFDNRDYSQLWPQLQVVSVWADGPSAQYANQIAGFFPHARVVPKGLFATEGIVSMSWGLGTQRPVSIESHFLEFLDRSGQPRLVEELVEGERYEPVLTTAGGLYRYALGDVIEVDGFVRRTPTIRFVGRTDSRCDLVGEKLDEELTAAAFAAAGITEPAILVPVEELPPHYHAVIETADAVRSAEQAESLDRALRECYHYGLAQGSGQLAPLTWSCTTNLSGLLHASWEALDKCSGDAKSSCLITSSPFAEEIYNRCTQVRSLS